MHLPGYPHYYVKDGERRAVYYTAEVRDLLDLGWLPEEKQAKPKEAEKPQKEAEVLKPEVVIEEADEEDELPDFEFMTKTELLAYAKDRGVAVQPTLLKAELVEICKGLV
jgi:hypothetical protein